MVKTPHAVDFVERVVEIAESSGLRVVWAGVVSVEGKNL